MKIKIVNELPKCDFCKLEAYYDAPTFSGSWAYMCAACLAQNGRDIEIGFKFKKRIKKNPKEKNKVLQGKILTSMENMVFDSLMDVECPSCGELIRLECDFHGTFTCEGCNQKVKVINPLY